MARDHHQSDGPVQCGDPCGLDLSLDVHLAAVCDSSSQASGNPAILMEEEVSAGRLRRMKLLNEYNTRV